MHALTSRTLIPWSTGISQTLKRTRLPALSRPSRKSVLVRPGTCLLAGMWMCANASLVRVASGFASCAVAECPGGFAQVLWVFRPMRSTSLPVSFLRCPGPRPLSRLLTAASSGLARRHFLASPRVLCRWVLGMTGSVCCRHIYMQHLAVVIWKSEPDPNAVKK